MNHRTSSFRLRRKELHHSVVERRGKILLMPAPSVSRDGQLRPYLPWGLLSLRALARSKHPDVEVWLPPEGLILGEHVITSSALANAIIDSIPDLDSVDAVGLSTMCSSFHHSIVLARRLKVRRPDLALWMGGPQASMVADQLLEVVPEVDAVFVGEGEETFAEMLARWASNARQSPTLEGIAGVMTREGGLTPRTPMHDLDQLPQVDLTDADLDVLRRQRQGGSDAVAIPLEVSRGCPGRCAFCSTRLFWGKKVRRMSDERVIDVIHRRIDETGICRFEILGDNFSASVPRLRSFCHALIRRAPEMSTPPIWMCDSTLDRLHPSDLDLLWSAGCRGFFVGVESGCQSTLDRLRKGVDLERELEVIDHALDKGFEIKASLIVGFPWETPTEVDRSFALHGDLLRRGVKECQMWLLCPLPGTALVRDHDVIFDRFGSRIAMDGLHLGNPIERDEDVRQLVEQSPNLFSQLGRFATPSLDLINLTATIETAFQVNLLHARGRGDLIRDGSV